MEISITLLIFGIVALTDFRSIISKKSKRTIALYSTLLGISFILIMLELLGVDVPSPSLIVREIILSFTKG